MSRHFVDYMAERYTLACPQSVRCRAGSSDRVSTNPVPVNDDRWISRFYFLSFGGGFPGLFPDPVDG